MTFIYGLHVSRSAEDRLGRRRFLARPSLNGALKKVNELFVNVDKPLAK